jgi:CRP-like cAMP-binding protein
MNAITDQHIATFRQGLVPFVIFTDEEWAIFSEHLYLRKLKKRDLFISSGQVCHEIAFIVSGSFRFYFVKDGAEISNYFCFEQELISSYVSFLRQEPSPINIEALEEAELVCFSHAAQQQLLQNPTINFKMERFGRKVAEYLIGCYEDRIFSFVTQTPEERYRQLLQKQPAFLQRIPQHYLANFLGITPVSLSRIRKRMQQAAVVKKEVALVS